MTIYRYRAKKDPQNIIDGRVSAESEKEAIEKIDQMGYLPVSIEQENDAASGQLQKERAHPRVGRIKSGEITVVSRQLASLLRSGVPFLSAIAIISEQSTNQSLKTVLADIHKAVKDGANFSTILESYPRVFSTLYVAMIRTGENSGSLPDVLVKIADYRVKQEEVMSRFRMAMVYPLLMAFVGLGTVIFMLTFVMPRLMKLYINLNQVLPLPTRILISISDALCRYGLWILILAIILGVVARRETKTAAGKTALSILKLRLPIFGPLMLKNELARFCRTLEMLIKSGLPILRAIDVAIPVLDNELLKAKLKQTYKELEQGGSLGNSFKGSKLIPIMMSNLIIVGEQSGKLGDSLAEVAATYEQDTDDAIKVMSSLLEPVMILVLGVIVGFMVVAMLLPIFEINVMGR